MPDNDASVQALQKVLDQHEDLGHLWIRTWGKSLVLCSGTREDRWDRARFTDMGRGTWMLAFPKPSGGWEKTPFVGPLHEVAEMLINSFGWHLEPT